MDLILYSKVPFTKEYNVVVNDWTIKTGNTKTALQLLLDDRKYTTFSNIDYYLTFPSGQIIIDKAIYNGNYVITEYNIVNYLSFNIYESTVRHQGVIPQTIYVGCKAKGEYLPYTVYAFVDKISMVNDCYVIDYTIDYMHTYMTQIANIRSHVIRWNQQKYYNRTGTLKYPKLSSDYSYKSISDFNILSLNSDQDNTLGEWNVYSRYYLLVQFQFYKLGLQGEKTDRFVTVYSIEMTDSDTPSLDFYSINDQIKIGNYLFLNQGTLQIIPNYYYEIMHVYIIPSQMINSAEFTPYVDYTLTGLVIDGNPNRNLKFGTVSYANDFYYSFKNNQFNTTESNLQHIISIGTFEKQVPFEFDNDNLTNFYYLKWYITGYDIDLVFRYKDNSINIISNFEYQYPYSVDNATANQLARFTRSYNEQQLDLKGAKVATGMVTGILGGAASIAMGAATGGASTALTAMGGGGSIIGSIVNTIFSAEDLRLQRDKNNARLYTNNSMATKSLNNIFNILYGIICLSIRTGDIYDKDMNSYKSIINFDDVNYEIEDSGFICDFMMDYDTLMNNTEAESKVLYFKGNETTIDGYFDNETNQILTAIFNKGFKLYNSQNYTKINKIV